MSGLNYNDENLKEIPLMEFDDREEKLSSSCKTKNQIRSQALSRDVDGKFKEFFKNFVSYFYNFCNNTSIHGFKFVGETQRYLAERLLWLMVICVTVFFSSSLIMNTYNKWMTSPVVVTFAMAETPIWKIPFPAITICSELNANPKIFNFTRVFEKYLKYEDIKSEEQEYFELFSTVCNKKLDFINKNSTAYITELQYKKFLNAFAKLEIAACVWLGDKIDCDEVLSHTITSEGPCRTFNMLHQEEIYRQLTDFSIHESLNNTRSNQWTHEMGYKSNVGLNTYPRRTVLPGVDGGFEIVLRVSHDELDFSCGNLQGYKVALHHPSEEPNIDNYFRVPLDQVVVAGVTANMITTGAEVKDYLVENRKCYLQEEKKLQNYKVYTQQNCFSECLRNYTIELCDCTPFYMTYDNTSICGSGKRICLNQAKKHFLLQVLIKSSTNKTVASKQCNCLPECTSVEYNSEVSQVDWQWQRAIKRRNYLTHNNVKGSHLSKLSVYFKEVQFLTSERHELYGKVDFLANCGGLLGLFIGFSFTSLMEIFYYCTIRLICNLRIYGCRNWSGRDLNQ